ncbi:MAG: P-II family nitrogen regulator [Gammaproteobacteria bacterium]|nr:P-II family nitrogen regulator [Gammaproteobacteria bacterium]
MKLKLIVALVDDGRTAAVIKAARAAGATGATIINGVRGEGLIPQKTFLGLDLWESRNAVLFLVAAACAEEILLSIGRAGRFDSKPGTGIAFQVDVEHAIGLRTQLPTIMGTKAQA